MRREFMLSEAQAMAPLVRSIVNDMVEQHARRLHFSRRLELMKGCSKSGRYDVRQAYYDAVREQAAAERKYDELRDELAELGVEMLDPVHGFVGFPFVWSVNEESKRRRRAYFLMKLGDDPKRGFRSWRFKNESQERRIPSHWHEEEASVTLPS